MNGPKDSFLATRRIAPAAAPPCRRSRRRRRASSRGLAAARGPKLWALLSALAACGGDAASPDELPDIEALAFAPELEVDLSRMTLLASGLYVRDVVTGTRAEAASQVGVRFDYEGWLHDGTPVDRGRYPAAPFWPGAFVSQLDGEVYYLVGSGQTIAGWDIGLVGMRVGGTRQLVVPPRLGYGAKGSPDGRVPPNAVLVYRFGLLAVEP